MISSIMQGVENLVTLPIPDSNLVIWYIYCIYNKYGK